MKLEAFVMIYALSTNQGVATDRPTFGTLAKCEAAVEKMEADVKRRADNSWKGTTLPKIVTAFCQER